MSGLSELGELLELLYGARRRFRTARGVLDHRQSSRLVRAAMQRAMERMNSRRGGGSAMFAHFSRVEGEGPPDLFEERLRFWWEPPDRLREEVDESRGSRRVSVHDGELWWLYTPHHGAISNVDLDPDERARHGAGGGEHFKPLLDPSGFLVALEFGEIRREAGLLRARGRPRTDLEETVGHVRVGYPGADEVELEVDDTIGVVRRVTAYLDGQEMSSTELTELVLDEDFPEDTFVFVPPPGEEVLPPESSQRRPFYTLEEAAVEAPFTVFHVPELPEGHWRLDVRYHPARQRPPGPANLGLVYSRADGRGSLVLMQRAAADSQRTFLWAGDPPNIEQIERDGVRYTIAPADPKDTVGSRKVQNQIAFERESTALEMHSAELDIETLLALATSLQPV